MQKGKVTHNPIVLQSCFHVFNNLKIKVNRKILINNFLSICSHNPPHIPSLPPTPTLAVGGGKRKKEYIQVHIVLGQRIISWLTNSHGQQQQYSSGQRNSRTSSGIQSYIVSQAFASICWGPTLCQEVQ